MNFKPMHEVEVTHDGLGKYRHINGSNLLHLLEKHGHQARIDLQEAKLIAKNP